MSESSWDPKQYHKFRAERSKPFYDLLAMVQRSPQMRVVDLGCGTGELTWVLHERLEAQETLGIDNSETMLGKGMAAEVAGLKFQLGDISQFVAEDYHLIFSNAALHWVDGHDDLFALLTQLLSPGGQLAIQVPVNDSHPAYTAAAAIAELEPFASALNGFKRQTPVLSPEQYAVLLHELGYEDQQVVMRVYTHELPNRDAVVEWCKGALLTAYLRRLPEDLRETFLHLYSGRIAQVLPNQAPFLFTFKRLFVWGRRGAGSMVTL